MTESAITSKNEEKIKLLRNYDIVEINPAGILYRMFANEEADTTIFLGGGCNSNCVMCPASDTERQHAYSYPPKLLLRYIDYLPDNLEYLVITGGEPTLNAPLFLDVLDRVRTKFNHTNVLLLSNERSFSNQSFFKILSVAYRSILG